MQNDIVKFVASLPEATRDYLAELQRNTQLVYKDEPYFSRVRFEPTISVDGSNNATYAFSAGQRVQAFNYGLNGPMTSAGFVQTTRQATLADTNLTTAAGRVTNNSDVVVIFGFGLLPMPKSDPVLLRQIIGEISVQGGFGANGNDMRFGTPLMWPGGGGLFGSSTSKLEMPNLGDAKAILPGSISNGLPGAADLRYFGDPIVWMPKPQSDAEFTLTMTIENAVSFTANARTAGTGIVAVTPPATAGAEGTYVDFMVMLIGRQIGPRGRNR